jgi:hypothetical protein
MKAPGVTHERDNKYNFANTVIQFVIIILSIKVLLFKFYHLQILKVHTKNFVKISKSVQRNRLL